LISYEELSGLVTVRPGDVLSPESVRASIRGLYSRALFREVSALVREKDATAELLFFLRPYPVVSDLEVSGAKRLTQAEILSASHLKRGQAVEGRDLAEAEDAVRDFLVRKGFPAATVTISASCGVDTGGGRVRIEVAEGSPASVGELRIEGATRFPPEKILEITGVEQGKPHDFRRFEEGLSRLRREYKRAGFLTAHVTGKVERCGPSPGAVCPEIRVEEGPEYEVRWEGPAAFSPDRLAEIGGLRGDEEISEGALVHDLRERLIAHYRGGGYLRAEVSVSVG